MMWVWIIIAVIVIAGLIFWMKSGKKGNQADISESAEAPQAPAQPEAPTETEAPIEQPEETPSDQEKTM